MNLKKENWKTYRFDVFVDNISERIKPSESESDVYIGLEHLDSGDLKIKRHDNPEKVKGVKLKFYEGDIIFGKRRAYLRKAGLAELSGICSAHAMVLRPKLKMSSKFLIFFIHSNQFMNRALQISEGSLSPTIKWKTLAAQEFKMPEKAEQERITKLMLTIDSQIQQTIFHEKNLRSLVKKLTDDFVDNFEMGNMLNNESSHYFTWKECVDKIDRNIDPNLEGVKYRIGGENIESSDYKMRSHGNVKNDYTGPAFVKKVIPNDILYVSRNPHLRKVAFSEIEGVCANTTFVIRSRKSILMQGLLKHIMLSESFSRYAMSKARGSTNPYVNWKDFNDYKFKLPDLEAQKKIMVVLDNCVANAEMARDQSILLKRLKDKLLDEIFD